MTDRTPVEILLVEDSEADIRLTREGLNESRILNTLHVARDGVEALDFLHRRGDRANAPKPDVILLDLNLPKKDGRTVLEEIKEDEKLRVIPVVILTTSREEEDILKSYQAHANCYIRKPINIDGFFEVVQSIENFWFQIVALPPKK